VNRARQAAKRLGATYEDDGANVRVEAPPFHIWNEGDVHELVCTDADDAAERMAYGLSRCPHGRDCDWCNDNRVLTVVA
jgi:hypothetical protein